LSMLLIRWLLLSGGDGDAPPSSGLSSGGFTPFCT